MEELREAYYGLLRRKEHDLADCGYDVTDTPVNIWQTNGRARYEAQQLLDSMEEGATPDELRQQIGGLDGIVSGLFDENGRPHGKLPAREREYLSTFHDALAQTGIGALGTHGQDATGRDVTGDYPGRRSVAIRGRRPQEDPR